MRTALPASAPRRLSVAALVAIAIALSASPARAYIETAYPLGRVLAETTNIVVLRVETVDKAKNTIIYRKVRDLKGTHPTDTIKHNIAQAGFSPREWQTVMAWAEPGQTALFFHNGGAGETCIANYWYQTYAGGEWWNMSHGEPYLLRAYAGKPDRLVPFVTAMLAGQEVVVPCMVDGDKNALQLRTARLQRMKASAKIQDYNPQRDFAGWGVEEIKPIADMPGFTHLSALARVSPDAAGIAPADFDGDGKIDLALFGAGRFALFQNGGASMNELPVPIENAHAADWADINGDGRPDLLVATAAGPRLLLNEKAAFRDITASFPANAYPHTLAAAWIDYDGDGRPDVLLADGFRGLRLYRNRWSTSQPDQTSAKNTWSAWSWAGPFDNANGAGFDAVYPPEKTPFDRKAEFAGKGGAKFGWQDGSGKIVDGQANDLVALVPAGQADFSVMYLARQIDMTVAADLPVSLGSDDTLTVWLNGTRLLAENVDRGCAPDQSQPILKLKAGRNTLLVKICNKSGGWGFYFQQKAPLPTAVPPRLFDDVSDRAGLGSSGPGADAKGDHLAVADVNNDGRPDVLYSAGTGLMLLNTPTGFVPARDCGIKYQAGRIRPAFGHCDGDRHIDLFVPQPTGGRLFRGDGTGHFTDVTASAGDLAKPFANATCAAWADLGGTGRCDLIVGCVRGNNRYFRNDGATRRAAGPTFADATDTLGLERRIFNTRSLFVGDVNRDGAADLVLANDGQDSVMLLGRKVAK